MCVPNRRRGVARVGAKLKVLETLSQLEGNMSRFRSLAAFASPIAGCLIAAVIGCRDTAAPRAPASINAISTTTQSVAAGQPLPEPPRVIVNDAAGHALSGVSVLFLDDAANRAPFITTTAYDGTASFPWFASTKAGPEHLTVRVQNLTPVEFVANVHASDPLLVIGVSELAQLGQAGGTLPSIPSMTITDAFDNPVSGVKATFAVSGPAASSVVNTQAITDGNGRVSAGAWTLGSVPGEYTLTVAFPGTAVSSFVFHARINVPAAVSQIAAGGQASCAVLTSNGGTYCWGVYLTDALAPSLIAAGITSDRPLVSLAVGQSFACGLTSDGAAYCWGSNAYGQLGVGSVFSSYVTQPIPVSGGVAFTRLVAGDAFVCGLTTTQQVYCWGDDTLGELGDSSAINPRAAPAPVRTTEHFTSIAAGYQHVCALATTGTTYCWGANDGGQLGTLSADTCSVQGYQYYSYGPTTLDVNCARTPIAVTNVPGTFTSLTASNGTCGLLADGEAYCWGFAPSKGVPTSVRFTSLAAGSGAVCGITTTQSIACWSYANPSSPPSNASTVSGIASPQRIVAGHQHWCAIDGAGIAFCWGDNSDGQLGNGTRVTSAVPLPVAAP